MSRWKFTFVGRRKGAIGIFYEISAERDGETCEKARLALYDEFDHVMVHKAQLVPDKPKEKKP